MSDAPKNAGNSLEDDSDMFSGTNVESKRKFSAISGGPPQLTANPPRISDIQTTIKHPNDVHPPVDILLLTVKDYEFSSCYMYMDSPYKCWFDGLGYVYFGSIGNNQEKLQVALVKCYEGSSGPGGSLITTKNAAVLLRPRAIISVGTCSGIDRDKTKLGDVVVSAKLTTYASKVVTGSLQQSTGMRSYVSKRFLDIIKDLSHGWKAPLENPEEREVKVYCDGEFLSGPELVSAEWRWKQLAEAHPLANAIESEGEGQYIYIFLRVFSLSSLPLTKLQELFFQKTVVVIEIGKQSVSENSATKVIYKNRKL